MQLFAPCDGHRYIDDENGDMATSMVVPSENQQWQKDTLKPLFE